MVLGTNISLIITPPSKAIKSLRCGVILCMIYTNKEKINGVKIRSS